MTDQAFDEQHFVTVGPDEIAYRKVGQGPVLVLVHGWPLHGESWRGLAARLAPHYTCLIPDLPGLGATRWSEQTEFSFHGHARAVRGLIEALGITEYAAAAFDTGATVARLMARDSASAMRALVVLNTEMPGHRPPWIPFYIWFTAQPGARTMLRFLLRRRTYLRSSMGFGGCFEDPGRIDDAFVARYVEPLLADPRRLEGMLRYLQGIDWKVVDGLAAVHGEIAIPSQLIWGVQDPTFPIEHARAMLPQFRTCDGLVEIDGARLLVHEEQPDAVAAAVTAFLARHAWS